MARSTASTRQPPAGGLQGTLRADDLLRALREGDRDAFVRFFRSYRGPVHHFVSRLVRDDAAAAGITRDALTAAFRRAILDDATDLETLTFRCALAACEAAAEPAPDRPEGESPAGPAGVQGDGGPEDGAIRRRFEAALESLEPRQRAALLLHDLQGMDTARSGEVLGLGAAAAGALLFRAREQFREALSRARSGRVVGRRCEQAGEALAGAVGLGMDEDGLGRLWRHASYCRSCRRIMKSWTPAGAGLATVLVPPPLPEELGTAPVFGDVVDGGAPHAGRSARRGLPMLLLPLARTGRALKGRAAAWVVAAACLALAGGLVVSSLGLRPVVLMQTVGPAIRLIVAPPADGSEPAAARGAEQDTTTTTAPAIGISSSGAGEPAAPGSAGSAQPGASVVDASPPGVAPPAVSSPAGVRETATERQKPGRPASAGKRADDSRKAGAGKTAKAAGAKKASAKALKASAKTAKPERKTAKAAGKKSAATGKKSAAVGKKLGGKKG